VDLLIASFDATTQQYAFECATKLRKQGLSVEVYPEAGKLKKQFEYASKRNIPFVALAGETEMQDGTLTVKVQSEVEQKVQETMALDLVKAFVKA
jgi:histidyl-tRNA synthetase